MIKREVQEMLQSSIEAAKDIVDISENIYSRLFPKEYVTDIQQSYIHRRNQRQRRKHERRNRG